MAYRHAYEHIPAQVWTAAPDGMLNYVNAVTAATWACRKKTCTAPVGATPYTHRTVWLQGCVGRIRSTPRAA
jgi:hypothetical protein